MPAINIGHVTPDDEPDRPDLDELLDRPDIYARSSKTSVFTTDEVQAMITMLDRVPVVDTIAMWRRSDEGERHAGGRPQLINDKALLVVLLLLSVEHSPYLISEIGNVFWRRLNTESRLLLGIGQTRVTDDHRVEEHRWYGRAERALERLYAVMNPEPLPRQLTNTAERRYAAAQLKPEVVEVMDARLHWFVNQMLEMTLRALPPEVLAGWNGDVTVDQTKIPAVGRRGRSRWKKDHGRRIGDEPESLMLPTYRWDWYVHDPVFRSAQDKGKKEATWGGAANFAVATQLDPTQPPKIPMMAVAWSMGTPNNDSISEETVALLASLRERGHPAGRITGDKEYFSIQLSHRLMLPVRALGYSPLFDYRTSEYGPVLGDIGGAHIIEGKLYCPQMPHGLQWATKQWADGEITDEVYQRRIEEQRPFYEVRAKEKPDANGAYPVVCPAYGLGATATCALKAIHPGRKKDKIRKNITPPPEHKRDRICTNGSVSVRPDESTRYLQEVRYHTRLWHTLSGHDRSVAEGFNGALKDKSKEDITNTGRRRGRSWVNGVMATAFAAVSLNLRMTKAWARDEAERRRDPATFQRKTGNFAPVSIKTYVPTRPMMDARGNITIPPKKEPKRPRTLPAGQPTFDAEGNLTVDGKIAS